MCETFHKNRIVNMAITAKKASSYRSSTPKRFSKVYHLWGITDSFSMFLPETEKEKHPSKFITRNVSNKIYTKECSIRS